MREPIYAGVELGGTKTIAVVGTPRRIVDRLQLPTTTPDETLGAIAAKLSEWRAAHAVEALGIASFGPIALDPMDPRYGHMLPTPKPDWSGAAVLDTLSRGFARTAIHTDVVGAALAEGAMGAARGLSDFVYVTIGTGVGTGIIAGGQPVSGLMHPEAGHWRVRRAPGDAFAGACPFHGDCLEGLVAGPALASRFGMAGEVVPDDHPDWAHVAAAIGEAAAMLFAGLATARIVIGGGVVGRRPWLLQRIRETALAALGGYLPFVNAASIERSIVPAALTDSGAIGALVLAERA